jgi:hypothetical protein
MEKLKQEKQRTLKQNASLHKFFSLLAEELNMAGLDAKVVLKPTYQIWWTEHMVKRDLWCQLQKAMTGKEHTSDLTRQEVDKVYEQLMQILGEKHGFYLDFPSSQSPLLEEI